jgi:PhoH-like ATPase
MKKTKTYVLDTNVLLSDPSCIDNFQDNNLIIPILVLEELDKQKGRTDDVGRNCREISRKLDQLSLVGSLKDGVLLRSGGTLRIVSSPSGYNALLPPELTRGSSIDNMIIGLMMMLMKSDDTSGSILVSKDINVRVKCSSLGIPAEDYLSIRVADNLESLYTGVQTVLTTMSVVDLFYLTEKSENKMKLSSFSSVTTYPNQIIVLKNVNSDGSTVKSALARVDESGTLHHIRKHDNIFGLKPRNKEQIFSFDLLMDPDVKLVTLTGKSGCGKTCLALAAALEQLDKLGALKTYKKLIVSRPVQPVGRDIGFLPGTLKEKMEPWISPIKDNLEFLLGAGKSQRNTQRKKHGNENAESSTFKDSYIDLLQRNGLIEIEAISFIRGRSIPNAFMIIDEAQNLSMHELKTIITRAGENTKIVLTGDIEQIDNVHVDTYTNGLTYAIEKFKNHSIAGHVTLRKGERSALATLASNIL